MPTLSLEATVSGYLTARPSHDLVTLADQLITREWWEKNLGQSEVVISDLVLSEAQRGDPETARSRLNLLSPFRILEINEEVEAIANTCIHAIPMPLPAANADAFHLAAASWYEIEYLVGAEKVPRILIYIDLR